MNQKNTNYTVLTQVEIVIYLILSIKYF